MNILAIDTLTQTLSITAHGPKGTATVSLTDGGQHAERLLEAIERAMGMAGFSPLETAAVACAEGPGSFTGLRLGWSSAKAIEMAANCPLIPIPPLPLYAAAFAAWPGLVVSALDAKKNRFYVQLFRRGEAVTEALDIDPRELASHADPAERVLVTGPDAALFAEQVQQSIPTLDVTPLPSGTGGISAEMEKFAEMAFNEYTTNVADHAGPLYVRQSDAEANCKQ